MINASIFIEVEILQFIIITILYYIAYVSYITYTILSFVV